MAIPPPISADDATAAIESIRSRRAQVDDPNAWRLSDDPAEVLDYLRRHSSGIPQWVKQADVLDGITLRLRLWWLGEQAELWLLESARRLDIPPGRIGPLLGISSRQGVHDRLRLARKKFERLTGQPHHALTGDRRRPEHSAEQTWLLAHRDEIRSVSIAAVDLRDLANDEAADWLADVARDIRADAVTPGSFQTLRFALAELEVSEAVQSADSDHPVHKLLSCWALLYAHHPG